MKRAAIFPLAVFLCAVSLPAQAPAPQNGSQAQAGRNFTQLVPLGPGPDSQRAFRDNSNAQNGATLLYGVDAAQTHSGCPVSMRAEQRSSANMMTVRSARDSRSQGVAQRIHLTLGDASKPATVVAATVTVRGTSAKSRVVPALQGSPYAVKTLHLVFAGDKAGANADLLLEGFTSVTSIRIDSLTFADGAMWLPSRASSCLAEPDPLMLIVSR